MKPDKLANGPEMPEMKEIFIDGIGGVSFLGGLIRADMIKLVPNPSDPNKPSVQTTHRLIISPQGFLQATNVMNDLVKKLKESGVLQTRDQESTKK